MYTFATRFICITVLIFNACALPPGPTDFPGGPGPIFSFGQNVLPAKSFMERLTNFYVEADNGQFFGQLFGSIYGFTDNLSIYVGPFWTSYNKFDDIKNTGLAYTLVQGEYAFYNHHTGNSWHQMTFVAAMRVRGTTPFTTFWTPKSNAYFIGFTQSHRSKHWYGYSAFGQHFCTTYRGEKPGNRSVFDLGGGPTLLDTKNSFLSFILECSAFYQAENKVNLSTAVDSCPHFIFLGPTLYFAHKHLFIYVGFQYPIVQVCSGMNSNHLNYRFCASFSWLF